jgi:large repetitive protein
VNRNTGPTVSRILRVLGLGALMLLACAAAAYAAVNHRPNANPDAFSTQEDALFSVPRASGVLMNDRDRDGDRLIARLNRATDHCTISLNRDGSFMYDPADNYHGTDSFGYKACEAAHPRVCSYGAGVKIDVRSVNDAPVAAGDRLRAKKNRVKMLSAPGLLANDIDADGDALHVAGYTQPRGGRVAVYPGGSIRFVPDKTFYGKTYFRYWAADDGGLKDDCIVIVRVRR